MWGAEAFDLAEPPSGDRDGAEHAWDELDQVAGESRDAMSRLLALTSVANRAFLDGRLEEVAAQKDVEDRFGDELWHRGCG